MISDWEVLFFFCPEQNILHVHLVKILKQEKTKTLTFLDDVQDFQ